MIFDGELRQVGITWFEMFVSSNDWEDVVRGRIESNYLKRGDMFVVIARHTSDTGARWYSLLTAKGYFECFADEVETSTLKIT